MSGNCIPQFAPGQRHSSKTPTPIPFHVITSKHLSRRGSRVALVGTVSHYHRTGSVRLVVYKAKPLRRCLQFHTSQLLRHGTRVKFRGGTRVPTLLHSYSLFIRPSVISVRSLDIVRNVTSKLIPIVTSTRLDTTDRFTLLSRSLFPTHSITVLTQHVS